MNKKLLLIALMLLSVVGMSAQRRGPGDHEKMRRELREYKIKYLAQEIELKSENQKQFVELYDKLETERMNAMNDARKLDKQVKNDANATDADFARASEAMAAAKIKVGEIEKAYDEKFSEFLTPKQIYKLHEAEDSFRQKMREMRDKQRGGHGGNAQKKRLEEM